LGERKSDCETPGSQYATLPESQKWSLLYVTERRNISVANTKEFKLQKTQYITLEEQYPEMWQTYIDNTWMQNDLGFLFGPTPTPQERQECIDRCNDVKDALDLVCIAIAVEAPPIGAICAAANWAARAACRGNCNK
jgi:hypothetical protein